MKLLFLLQEKPQIGAENESRQRKCPLMGDLIPDLSPTTPLQMSSTSPKLSGPACSRAELISMLGGNDFLSGILAFC